VNPELEAAAVIGIERRRIRCRRQRSRLEDSADGTARTDERQATNLPSHDRNPPATANILLFLIPQKFRKFRKFDPMSRVRVGPKPIEYGIELRLLDSFLW
jgi:hypothetical protein